MKQKGNAELPVLLLLAIATWMIVLSGCANRRYYIGVDYYGEPSGMTHEFKTKSEDRDGNKY